MLAKIVTGRWLTWPLDIQPRLVEKPVVVLSNNDGCVIARRVPMTRADVPYWVIRGIPHNPMLTCGETLLPVKWLFEG